MLRNSVAVCLGRSIRCRGSARVKVAVAQFVHPTCMCYVLRVGVALAASALPEPKLIRYPL